MLRFIFLFMLLSISFALTEDSGFSLTYAPGKGKYAKADLSEYALSNYLAQCEINKPELVNAVRNKLKKGDYYRKGVKDQKKRPTTLTVYVDNNNTLHIVTNREETCPTCKGKGTRASPLGQYGTKLGVDFRCVPCEGKGILPRQTRERYFVLASADYENPREAEKFLKQQSFKNAPRETEQYIEMLASKNPQERLDACVWLDEHYVNIGIPFQQIMPMLKKARYQEVSEEKKLMVWQFWAGKDDQAKRDVAFYRIYADAKTGKINKKGFYRGK